MTWDLVAFWNFASEHSCIFKDVKSRSLCNVDFCNVLRYLFYINSVLRISGTFVIYLWYIPKHNHRVLTVMTFNTGERCNFSIKEFNIKSTVIKIPFQIAGKKKTDGSLNWSISTCTYRIICAIQSFILACTAVTFPYQYVLNSIKWRI